MKKEMVKITQLKSMIRATKKQKASIKALGLGRPGYFVKLQNNVCLEGQIRKVSHLIRVEKI